MQKKWIPRTNRIAAHIRPETMYVCSEHFEDDDFTYRSLLQADMLSDELLKGHNIALKSDAVPNTDRCTGLLRMGRPTARKALKRTIGDVEESDARNEPSSSTGPSGSSNSRSKKRSRQPIDIEEIDRLLAENQRILGADESQDYDVVTDMEICVSKADQESSLLTTQNDKSVQFNVLSKSKQIQVGNTFISTTSDESQVELQDYDEYRSASDSEADETRSDDPDYAPQNKTSVTNLDFARHFSFTTKRTGKKTHLSFPVSKVIGELN